MFMALAIFSSAYTIQIFVINLFSITQSFLNTFEKQILFFNLVKSHLFIFTYYIISFPFMNYGTLAGFLF